MATQLRAFLNDLDQVIKLTQRNMSDKLIKGQCGSLEAYHREVGRCEGLGMAVGTAREMLGQMELAADEGELPEMPQANTPRKKAGKKG